MNPISEHENSGSSHRREAREGATRMAFVGLAITGALALILLGTLGTVYLARTGASMFPDMSAAVSSFSARLFPMGAPELRIELASYNVEHEKAFEFAWTIDGKPEGARYALIYECADGLSFMTPTPDSGEVPLPCGDVYEFDSERLSLTLIPLSTEHRFIDVGVKLLLVKDAVVLAEDDVLLTVKSGRAADLLGDRAVPPATKAATPRGAATTPVYTTVTVPRVSDPQGSVDFSVEILRVGTFEERADRFADGSTTLTRGKRGGVVFTVRNLGTKASDAWDFEVELPTRPSYTFKRSKQPPLFPGDKIEYTLGFDRLTNRESGAVVVRVDPGNQVAESNESNNRAERTVVISN